MTCEKTPLVPFPSNRAFRYPILVAIFLCHGGCGAKFEIVDGIGLTTKASHEGHSPKAPGHTGPDIVEIPHFENCASEEEHRVAHQANDERKKKAMQAAMEFESLEFLDLPKMEFPVGTLVSPFPVSAESGETAYRGDWIRRENERITFTAVLDGTRRYFVQTNRETRFAETKDGKVHVLVDSFKERHVLGSVTTCGCESFPKYGLTANDGANRDKGVFQVALDAAAHSLAGPVLRELTMQQAEAWAGTFTLKYEFDAVLVIRKPSATCPVC